MIEKLLAYLKEEFTLDVFKQIKTKKGKTQESESIYMKYVIKCINKLDESYKSASSQEQIDFRFDNGV